MNHNPLRTNIMCSHGMFCGAGSFKGMDADDDGGGGGDQPCKTPPGALSPSPSPSLKGTSKKKAGGKNPYAGRGLDKFSSVMSELEARREKIVASAGPQGVALLVRFMHSNSSDWVPIVVRLPDPPTSKERKAHASAKRQLPAQPPPQPAQQQPAEAPKEAAARATAQPSASTQNKAATKSLSFSWGRGNNNNNNNNNKRRWRGSSYNWVVVMVIILACLMVFGRVFAICCTSIWWYLVPTLNGDREEEGQNRRSMKKKKDYGRRMSAKGINTSNNIIINATSPRSAHPTPLIGKRG